MPTSAQCTPAQRYELHVSVKGCNRSFPLIARDRLPRPGDVYAFTVGSKTLGGVSYFPGDRLEILERTQEAPYGRLSSLGNLRVRCKHFDSIWTNIEIGVVEGWLVLARPAECGTEAQAQGLCNVV